MRLFIAVNFSYKTRSRLNILCEELRSRATRGRFCRPDNLHLTLAFLGECDESEADAAKSAMNAIAFEPFELTIERVGRFKRAGGDVWWAGLKENRALLDLQNSLTNELIKNGFHIEERKYSPHITLGRSVVTDVKPYLTEPFGETVSLIDLMKSDRIKGVLTYTSVYRRGKWLNPIVIEEYSSVWVQEFERIKDYIKLYLTGIPFIVHHVGSTAVPGLAAKPILDINVEIGSYDLFGLVCERLAKAGWRHEGDYGITGREAFQPARMFDFMPHHLYVSPANSAELENHLAFRDYLRANRTDAAEYAKLKKRLASQHGNDIDAYVDGKAAFIKHALLAAKEGKEGKK